MTLFRVSPNETLIKAIMGCFNFDKVDIQVYEGQKPCLVLMKEFPPNWMMEVAKSEKSVVEFVRLVMDEFRTKSQGDLLMSLEEKIEGLKKEIADLQKYKTYYEMRAEH